MDKKGLAEFLRRRRELLRPRDVGLVDYRPWCRPDPVDTLAMNPVAVALLGDQTRHTGLARSGYYRWFMDPAERPGTESHSKLELLSVIGHQQLTP